jgi:hypothetical protein
LGPKRQSAFDKITSIVGPGRRIQMAQLHGQVMGLVCLQRLRLPGAAVDPERVRSERTGQKIEEGLVTAWYPLHKWGKHRQGPLLRQMKQTLHNPILGQYGKRCLTLGAVPLTEICIEQSEKGMEARG